MSPRSVLFFALVGGGAAASIAGCAFHDWGSYAGGTSTPEAGSVADTGTPATVLDAGDAGPQIDPYGAIVRADGPIAWYRFEEPIGAITVADVLGEHPGTIETTAYFGATGISGRAVTLDGSGGFDMGDAFDFAGRNSFTFEAWIRTKGSPSADQRIAYKRYDADPSLGYVVYLGGDLTPHFEVSGAGLSSWSTTPIPNDAFTHVVVTVAYVDGQGTATLWANGQKANNRGFLTSDALPDTTVPFTLCPSCKGTLDEVAIYDKALPDARILAHYLAGSGGP